MNIEQSVKALAKEYQDIPGLLPWTLDQGLQFVQALESFLCQRWQDHENGALVHCALGGSVLHKGESEKDLDVFIYPHQNGYDANEVVEALAKHYSTELILCKFEYDNKIVFKAYINNQRVDFFFL
jgi:hypothetical protein